MQTLAVRLFHRPAGVRANRRWRMAFLAFGSVHATGGLSTLHEAAYAEMGVPSFFDGPEKGRLELRKLG